MSIQSLYVREQMQELLKQQFGANVSVALRADGTLAVAGETWELVKAAWALTRALHYLRTETYEDDPDYAVQVYEIPA